MNQRIDPPNDQDIDHIARGILNASQLARDLAGRDLEGTLEDLGLLQTVIASGALPREATWQLQSLGLAFGKVFVNLNPGYDWWMVEDDYGRDPAIRYKQTSLLLFPQTMLSKRIEADGTVDVAELYHGLLKSLEDIIQENFSDA